MDPREVETLAQRLIANPHDEQALAVAHQRGSYDPRSYALLLERVAQGTTDPLFAAHWYSEAATVWSSVLGDQEQGVRALQQAALRDASNPNVYDRLAQVYRERGDAPALADLQERMVEASLPLLQEQPESKPAVVATLEELGKLFGEGPLANTERAIRAWVRLAEVEPTHAYAIYCAREMLKREQRFADAIPFFAKEHALVDDPQRKLALYRDEADCRRQAGDLRGATDALRSARSIESGDPALVYEFGLSVVQRIEAGAPVDSNERQEAAQALLGLAEEYPGEYGMNYALSALRATPGNDRAMQLADYYAEQLGRSRELTAAYSAYLQAAPAGFMADKARAQLTAFGEPLPSTPLTSGQEPSGEGPASPSLPHAPASQPVPAASPSIPLPLGAPQPSASVPQRSQPAAPEVSVPALLSQASEEAARGRKPQAFDKYREVLAIDAANPEALGWVQDFLHQRRKFAELRDVLLAAARVSTVLPETRKDQLRQVAGICESKLRDFDTAILALKQITQIDRGDIDAREQLCSLLERQKRWDDLAPLLEQQAMTESDVEAKIAIEKKVAALHEKQRGDHVAAAEAWVRIATLAHGDESAIHTAVRLFEQGQQLEAAANAIVENLTDVEDVDQKATLFDKLGELRAKLGDKGGAGDAYAEAAELLKKDEHYALAAQCYVDAERLGDAANVCEQRAQLFDGKRKAELLAQAAELLVRAGNAPAALPLLELAVDLDPENDAYAEEVERQYLQAANTGELVVFLLHRGEKLADKARRVAVRHRAAAYQRSVSDEEAARDTMLLVLQDGEDRDALVALLGWAEQREDNDECADLLKRLTAMSDGTDKLDFAMREADLLATRLGDADAAIERYEAILAGLDPRSRKALSAIAELELTRDNHKQAAGARERELALCDGAEKAPVAASLAKLYEGPLDDPTAAVRVLDIVHAADAEDFEAVARLLRLCERLEDWPRVVNLLGLLVEVEGDEEEASNLTRQIARTYHEKLGKGDEALAALEKLADEGDHACQQAYVELGLELGWKGIVATKLVAWNESVTGTSRVDALRQAFGLFADVGRDADARTVGLEVCRSGGFEPELASQLEVIAVRLRDLEALALVHELLVKPLTDHARAEEYVRQAESMVQAAADPVEAIQHGELGLAAIDPSEADPLLRRLLGLSDAPGHQIDLYERQVIRCKQPTDRIAALAKAAQVAAEKGEAERARDFFNAALTGGLTDDALESLEAAARAADQAAGGSGALLRMLAESFSVGGQGSRDGGRTRSALLRRAAAIAVTDLGDLDRAFGWLGESIVAHVDDAALDSLDALGASVGDMGRVEMALNRALEEVYDGPLVRRLLRKRATLRKDVLRDYKGAAADLKRLHDLAPADQELTQELSDMLTHLRDHRGMIELYEDQIMRGRDPQQRAEIARKVARIWEEYLGDAREAGDAWRRVLRMKPGDKEAQAGLERAKAGKLKVAPPMPATGQATSAMPLQSRPPTTPSARPPAMPSVRPPATPLSVRPGSGPPPPAAGMTPAEAAFGPPLARVATSTPPPAPEGPEAGYPPPGTPPEAADAFASEAGAAPPLVAPEEPEGHFPSATSPQQVVSASGEGVAPSPIGEAYAPPYPPPPMAPYAPPGYAPPEGAPYAPPGYAPPEGAPPMAPYAPPGYAPPEGAPPMAPPPAEAPPSDPDEEANLDLDDGVELLDDGDQDGG